jgi:ferredoxin-NADP reductase
VDCCNRRPAVSRRWRFWYRATHVHAAVQGGGESTIPALLLYSSRTFEDIIYRQELDQMAARNDGLTVVYTLTRQQPPGWTGGARRIDRSMLANVGPSAEARPKIFICGPTSLVESTAQSLLELDHARNLIKTERFGPTGARV